MSCFCLFPLKTKSLIDPFLVICVFLSGTAGSVEKLQGSAENLQRAAENVQGTADNRQGTAKNLQGSMENL